MCTRSLVTLITAGFFACTTATKSTNDGGVSTDALGVDAGEASDAAADDGAAQQGDSSLDGGADARGTDPDASTPPPPCGDSDVVRRLDDVTIMNPCTLEITDGLRVEGTLSGVAGSSITIAPGAQGIVLMGPSAAIENISILSEGAFGLALSESTGARIENVEIDAIRGVGLYVETSTGVTLHNVTLTGPVTAENAAEERWQRVQGSPTEATECVGCTCTPGDRDAVGGRVCSAEGEWVTWTTVLGLYVVASEVSATGDVRISGFAAYGAAFEGAMVDVEGLQITDNVGVALRLEDSDLAAETLVLTDTYDGAELSMGALLQTGSALTVGRLEISDNAFGLTSTSATVAVDDLDMTDQREIGIWQESREALLTVSSGRVTRSGSAGIRTWAMGNFSLTDVAISDNGFARPDYGDGVALASNYFTPSAYYPDVEPPVLTRVSFTGNARAGLIVAMLNVRAPYPRFTDCTATASAGGYGALIGNLQSGSVLFSDPATFDGWSTGLTRDPDTYAMDIAVPRGSTLPFTDPTVEVVAPPITAVATPSSIIGPSYIVGPMF